MFVIIRKKIRGAKTVSSLFMPVCLLQLERKLDELKRQYDEKLIQKEELKKKAAFMELMMERARRLVEGLAGERIRWMNTVKVCQGGAYL